MVPRASMQEEMLPRVDMADAEAGLAINVAGDPWMMATMGLSR